MTSCVKAGQDQSRKLFSPQGSAEIHSAVLLGICLVSKACFLRICPNFRKADINKTVWEEGGLALTSKRALSYFLRDTLNTQNLYEILPSQKI